MMWELWGPTRGIMHPEQLATLGLYKFKSPSWEITLLMRLQWLSGSQWCLQEIVILSDRKARFPRKRRGREVKNRIELMGIVRGSLHCSCRCKHWRTAVLLPGGWGAVCSPPFSFRFCCKASCSRECIPIWARYEMTFKLTWMPSVSLLNNLKSQHISVNRRMI